MNWLRIGLRTAEPLVFCLLLCPASQADTRWRAAPVDEDRDGRDDRLEQALLEKFAPVLHLSEGECDGKPAEFRPGTTHPEVVARNGTIYGQVFRRSSSRLPAALIEIHYYHLWGRDCGRAGHVLDAEHVSVLVEADGEDREADAWKAVFWYASAHEDTVCELSSAAKAKELGAEDHGPDVWISRGKHASFLSQSACRGGCGGDVCEGSQSFHPTKIVNIGERGAWLNGCSWVASGKWRMLQKMGTDFTDDRIALLGKNEPGGVVTLNPQLRRTQAVLSAGDSTVEAVGISGRKTGLALAEAGTETDSALQAAGEAAGEAGRATDRALAGSTTKTGDALSAAGSSTIHALAVSARSAAKALRTAVRSTSSFLGIGRN